MKRFASVAIILVFTVLFYLQNRYAILCIDDWVYAFIVHEDAKNYLSVVDDNVIRTPVSSFSDALLSQSCDYFKSNGRFIIHTLVQYFCGSLSMNEFVIINSAVFGLFTLLVFKLVGSRKDSLVWLLTILSGIWVFIPHKGYTFMGNISLSVNYLWSSVAMLSFLLLYERMSTGRKSPCIVVLSSVYAFLVGSLQESFSICISGALLLTMLIRYRTLSMAMKTLSVNYVCGTLICVCSPANFGRAADIGGFGLHYQVFLGLLSSPLFVLMLCVFTVLVAKGIFTTIIERYLLLFLAIAVNLLFIVFVAYNGRHQLTSLNVLLFVLLFRLWKEYGNCLGIYMKIATIGLIMTAIVSYYPVLQVRKKYYDSYSLILERARNNRNGIVDGSEFEDYTKRIKSNRIFECNYVMTFTFQDWDFYEHSLSVYLTRGRNNRLIETIED